MECKCFFFVARVLCICQRFFARGKIHIKRLQEKGLGFMKTQPRLLVAEAAKLESGAFYLDREPQVKHMAGRLVATKKGCYQVQKCLK